MFKLIAFSLRFGFVFFLLTNCTSSLEKSKENQNDNVFFQYMEETFNRAVYDEEHMYIVIPCAGCLGCDQVTYAIFTDNLLNSEDFTLIICDPANKGLLIPSLKADNVIFDFKANMAGYYFGYGYPTCIIVKNGEVVDTYSLTPVVLHWFKKAHSTDVS